MMDSFLQRAVFVILNNLEATALIRSCNRLWSCGMIQIVIIAFIDDAKVANQWVDLQHLINPLIEKTVNANIRAYVLYAHQFAFTPFSLTSSAATNSPF